MYSKTKILSEGIQNDWGSGFRPSFLIKKLEHDVSITGSVSVLRRREEDVNSVGSLRKG
jgi:hypothetical protein